MRFLKNTFFQIALLWLLLAPTVFAQDSISSEIPSKKIVFTEDDIIKDQDTIVKLNFESGFQKKYEADEFNYEIKIKQKSIWDRFTEWLSDVFRRLFNFENRDGSETFVKILLKIIAVIIILIVIFLIVKAIMNKDGQWIFGRNSDKKMIRYDEIEKNLRITDFEKLIADALQSNQKRLSIRYYYLWLLKQMAEKQLIEWDLEKTNSDYFNEITDPKLKQDFGYLSYLYNYIWYGEFDIDEETLEKAKTTFENTIRSL